MASKITVVSEGNNFRGDSWVEWLSVTVFTEATVVLSPHLWRETNVCSSYWRLYRNDADGAYVRVYDESGNRKRFDLNAGVLYLIPAWVRFDCGCDAPAVPHWYAHFGVSGLSGLISRERFAAPVTLHDIVLTNAVSHLLSTKNSDPLTASCLTKSLLYAALAAFLADPEQGGYARYVARAHTLEPILPALRRIERRFADPLTVTDLAEACCLSREHFIRRFKIAIGDTPAHYLQTRRVEAAANRLLFSNDSIDAIATDCGFSNRFYLTRVFTRDMGIAPAAYRKKGAI